MKYIAITGGKGGTGKTLISVNLAVKFAMENKRVLLIDCDTENPNSHILMGKSLENDSNKQGDVNIFFPKIDNDKCTKCGICRQACYRHAILQMPKDYPTVFEHMCSGCQTCSRLCPNDAISESERPIGKYYILPEVHSKLDLIVGELKEGEALSIKILEELLRQAEKLQKEKNYDVIILDSPPGAHCDVELILKSADAILCVTEPTPFGEHDLKRILELIKIVNRNAKVIMNRANLTDYREPIETMLKEENSEIIGEIPVDRTIIEDYAKGVPFVTDPRDFLGKSAFIQVYKNILQLLEEEA